LNRSGPDQPPRGGADAANQPGADGRFIQENRYGWLWKSPYTENYDDYNQGTCLVVSEIVGN